MPLFACHGWATRVTVDGILTVRPAMSVSVRVCPEEAGDCAAEPDTPRATSAATIAVPQLVMRADVSSEADVEGGLESSRRPEMRRVAADIGTGDVSGPDRRPVMCVGHVVHLKFPGHHGARDDARV